MRNAAFLVALIVAAAPAAAGTRANPGAVELRRPTSSVRAADAPLWSSARDAPRAPSARNKPLDGARATPAHAVAARGTTASPIALR